MYLNARRHLLPDLRSCIFDYRNLVCKGIMGELGDRRMVLSHVFNQYDRNGKGELSPIEVQMLHGDLRMGGISYPQVGIHTC